MLCFNMMCWLNKLSVINKNKLQRVRRSAKRTEVCVFEDLNYCVYENKTLKMSKEHPLLYDKLVKIRKVSTICFM